MNRFREFVRRERLYILLLVFIVLLNILAALPDTGIRRKTPKAASVTVKEEDEFLKRENVEKALNKDTRLAALFGLSFLLILAVLFFGIMIDGFLVSLRLIGKTLEISTYKVPPVKWNVWDVAKVVILFLFFGYMVTIITALVARVFPLLKNNDFSTMVISSILDALVVVFIIYFAVRQYEERLISLGISFKNFLKNVFYGITGYIACVPVLIGLLILTAFVTNVIKYTPEKQPVVEMFMKEQNAAFLIYTSIFASVFGPIVEELFFRGFMYNAFKKYVGIFWAAALSACMFSALHSNIVGFLPIMVLGLLLAYLYEKTGTLVSSITVHVIHNFSMIFFVFLLRELKG